MNGHQGELRNKRRRRSRCFDTDDKICKKKAMNIEFGAANLWCELERNVGYLTNHSSDYKQFINKIKEMQLQQVHQIELCRKILYYCSNRIRYDRYYGLLASSLCALDKIYIVQFEKMFIESYNTIQRFDSYAFLNRSKNEAIFFAHLIKTNSISWNVLSVIKLNETDITISSRCYVKNLLHEVSQYMGLEKFTERLKEKGSFSGLFPKYNGCCYTPFAINFYTKIGLRAVIDEDMMRMNKSESDGSDNKENYNSDKNSNDEECVIEKKKRVRRMPKKFDVYECY